LELGVRVNADLELGVAARRDWHLLLTGGIMTNKALKDKVAKFFTMADKVRIKLEDAQILLENIYAAIDELLYDLEDKPVEVAPTPKPSPKKKGKK
jgi:hypothetical protein